MERNREWLLVKAASLIMVIQENKILSVRKVKAGEHTSHIFIIMLTAKDGLVGRIDL